MNMIYSHVNITTPSEYQYGGESTAINYNLNLPIIQNIWRFRPFTKE